MFTEDNIIFDKENKRISFINCDFQNVEIYKNGISIADVPIEEDGTGSFTNSDDLTEGSELRFYPYNEIIKVLQ